MRSILHLNRSEPAELAQWAHWTLAHSIDHDLGYWRTVSSLLTGWLIGRGGDLDAGCARLKDSLDDYTASGSRLGLPHFLLLFADLRRVAGDTDGALSLVRAGEEHIEATGERFSESELHRFKGRLLSGGAAPDHDAARAAFERAVTVARDQNAKVLELQAVTRLAEHQLKLGEASAALDRAAELAGWFGEDSQLADVLRARKLLATEPMPR
jgi:predicted ATPase